MRGRTRDRLIAVILVAAALLARPAAAHEFWIEPTQAAPQAGDHIAVYLCNGDGYDGWSLPRDPQRLADFSVYGPRGKQPIVGRDGSDPAGYLRLEQAGPHVLAYVSHPGLSLMPPAKFDRYLEDKGLDAVRAERQAQRPDDRPVRESFTRYAKLLLPVGPDGAIADRRLGMPLELLAASGNAATGGRSFQLLALGQPVAGALVKATRLGTADDELVARTSADGRVSFRLDRAGFWRVAAVQMKRAPSRSATQWHSDWASLTFPLSVANASGSPVAGHCRNRVLASMAQVSP